MTIRTVHQASINHSRARAGTQHPPNYPLAQPADSAAHPGAARDRKGKQWPMAPGYPGHDYPPGPVFRPATYPGHRQRPLAGLLPPGMIYGSAADPNKPVLMHPHGGEIDLASRPDAHRHWAGSILAGSYTPQPATGTQEIFRPGTNRPAASGNEPGTAYPHLPPASIQTGWPATETDRQEQIAPDQALLPELDSELYKGGEQQRAKLAKLPAKFKIAGLEISRDTLLAMGARLDADGSAARGPVGEVADRLSFDAGILAQRMRTHPGSDVQDILSAIAMKRSHAGPLITHIAGSNAPAFDTMNAELGKLSAIANGDGEGTRNAIRYFMPGGKVVTYTGHTLQALGVYKNLKTLNEAIREGNVRESIQSGGALAWDGVKGIQALFPDATKQLLDHGVKTFEALKASHLGLTTTSKSKTLLKLTKFNEAVGPLGIGLDVYAGIQGIIDGANSDGKEAQDKYVAGGLALASAGIGLGGAAAAAAGSVAAGPVGLALSVLTTVGHGIYSSARYVDEIDDHTRLSASERFTTGLRSFLGLGASQNILDRVAMGQARQKYEQRQSGALQAYLSKHGGAFGVYGNAVITPDRVHHNAGDDRIDASDSLYHVANAVRNPRPGRPDVLWATGAGDDTLTGSRTLANHFVLDEGRKRVTGGHLDDQFHIRRPPAAGSQLDGAGGNNVLNLSALRSVGPDVEVVLPTGGDGFGHGAGATPGSLRVDGVVTPFNGIDNVNTSSNTRTQVLGNAGANIFRLHGRDDTVIGGGGDDTFVVKGGGAVRITAGAGDNHYQIARTSGWVDVTPADYAQTGGRDVIYMDYDVGELSVRAVNDKLFIKARGQDLQRSVTLNGVYRRDASGVPVAARADASIMIVTRDGYALAPELATRGQNEDGFVNLVSVTPTGIRPPVRKHRH